MARPQLADTDFVCRIWRQADSGIWEVRSEAKHFTHSKMMCWVALDCALRLSNAGHIASRHATGVAGREAGDPRVHSEERCWSHGSALYPPRGRG